VCSTWRGEEPNEGEKERKRERKRERRRENMRYQRRIRDSRNSHVERAEERTRTESRCALERGSQTTELSAALASYGRAFRRLRVGGRKKRRREPGGPSLPSSARSRARGDERGEGEARKRDEESRERVGKKRVAGCHAVQPLL